MPESALSPRFWKESFIEVTEFDSINWLICWYGCLFLLILYRKVAIMAPSNICHFSVLADQASKQKLFYLLRISHHTKNNLNSIKGPYYKFLFLICQKKIPHPILSKNYLFFCKVIFLLSYASLKR